MIVLDDTDAVFWTVYSPDLHQTGYVNKNYLVRNDSSRADDNSTIPLGFPQNGRGECSLTSEDHLEMRVELKNLSGSKTIVEYTFLTSAEDENGNNVFDDYYWIFEETDYKTLSPGEVKFTDYFYLPHGRSIRKVCVEIKSCRLSDGTYIELTGGSRPYTMWNIN